MHKNVFIIFIVGKGQGFHFSVNNVPVFAKGSNLVPLSVIPEQIANEDKIKRLIKDAVDTNMNMLRIVGNGVYLPSSFYDLAASNGILIWQDFMFSSALYPSDEEFLR